VGFLGSFCIGFLADFCLQLKYSCNFSQFLPIYKEQSISKMLFKALLRLKFGLSYLDSIKIPTAKKVSKMGLFG